MPKEVIYQQTPFHPVVVWDRDQDVRIGLTVSDTTLVEALYGEQAEAIGKAFRALREGCDESPSASVVGEALYRESLSDREVGEAIIEAIARVSPFESLWSDLNRTNCNALVRVVRRARNAAYGGDE